MEGILLITVGGLLWLACAVGIAADARRQRVNPVFWTVAALFSGPLALADYRTAREVAMRGRGPHFSRH